MRVPTGRDVRRWSRHRAGRRSEGAFGDLLSDVYSAVLAVTMSVAIALSVAARLGADLADAPPVSDGGLVLAPGWLAILVGPAALAAIAGLAARLGPVAVPEHQGQWWLAMPVGRRSLLRPAAARWPLLAVLPGAVVAAAITLVLAPGAGAAALTAAVALGGAVAAAVVLVTALTETSRARHRRARAAADICLALVPLTGGVVAVGSMPVPAVPVRPAAPAVVAVVVAAGLAVLVDLRLARMHGSLLRERGAVGGEALGAVLALDTRALGRALSASAEPAERRRSARLSWLPRVPGRWRARAVLVAADALVLLRSPRHLVQLLVTATLPALALAVPQPVPVVTLVLLVGGAYAGALATADGARRAQVAPVLDALLPLGQNQVRRLRLVVPAAAMVLWSGAVFAVIGVRYGDPASWLLLGVLSAPVWAAGAVRAAYRPLPDFSGPLIHTPMGALPPGMSTVVSKGPDVAILCAVPVLIALLLGAVPSVLLAVQAALAVAALAVAGHPGKRRP